MFALCSTDFDVHLDLLAGSSTAAQDDPDRPMIVPGIDDLVWSFTAANDLDDNFVVIDEAVKTQFLQLTDDFTMSFWLKINPTGDSSYIFSFEIGNTRYFSLYDTARARSQLYYNRDPLAVDDVGNRRVVLSFYYDRDVFEDGLRDGEWHFISLTIDFPNAILVVDGYEIRPTGGNYYDVDDTQLTLPDVYPDDEFYPMPAPIESKDASLISQIQGHVGGSERSNRFSMGGQIRQMVVTDLLSRSTYECLASCNNLIYSTLTLTPFVTFFNPVRRIFTYNHITGDHDEYTDFLQTLFYQSDGYIPPQPVDGGGESRIIRLQVCT